MSMKSVVLLTVTLFFAGLSLPAVTGQLSPEEMEEWLFDDSDSLIAEVNEGELEFLATSPQGPVHHHHNRVRITDASVEDGWVGLEQCHRHLDQVALAQIVFRPDRVRGLKVTRAENINKAWVEGASVQLQGVQANALLCVQADTRSFVYNGDGTFSLHSGPFMRRFLDGYYPMQVTLDVRVESSRLQFYQMLPQSRDGLTVRHADKTVHYEALFEGRLRTEIMFHDLVVENVSAELHGRGKIAAQIK